MPPVVVSPDSFKGTLGAADVAEAIAAGLQEVGWRADRCPVADGGEGTLEVLREAVGGAVLEADAHDPLGRSLRARFALLGDGRTALVEAAAASGLGLLAEGASGCLRDRKSHGLTPIGVKTDDFWQFRR